MLPGALIATTLLQLTFESLPLYVRSVEGLPALKAFGGAAVLLVWLYLMGNVVLIGGAITWWSSRGREAAAATAAVAQRARERERVGPVARAAGDDEQRAAGRQRELGERARARGTAASIASVALTGSTRIVSPAPPLRRIARAFVPAGTSTVYASTRSPA